MRQEPVDPDSYARVFQVNPEGIAIFEELARIFYDVQCYTKGDPHDTAFNEGKRSVIAFIIKKIQMAEQQQQEEQPQEEE